MPATSKAQLRFMAAVMNGSIKKLGLPKDKAAEFVHSTHNYNKLPEKRKKFNRLSKYFNS